MSTVIRYLAAVCLAIALTAVLAGSDELARSDWLGDGSCSSSTAHSNQGPARTGAEQNKKVSRDANTAARCMVSLAGEPMAALENM